MEKKTVNLPLRMGLDESIDEASDQSGLRELINGAYDQDGALIKRGGFKQVADSAQTPRGLVATANSLGILSAAGYEQFIPGNPLTAVNTYPVTAVTANHYWYTGRSVRFADSARYVDADGNEFFAVASIEVDTEDSITSPNGESCLHLFVNGAKVYSGIAFNTNVTGVRVLADESGNIYFLDQKSNQIQARVFEIYLDGIEPAMSLIDTVTVSTDCDSTVPMDAILADDGKVYVAHVLATGVAEVNQLTYVGSPTFEITVTDTLSSISTNIRMVGLCGVSAARGVLALGNDSDAVVCFVLNLTTLTQVDSETGQTVVGMLNVAPYLASYTSDTDFAFIVQTSDDGDTYGHVREQAFELVASVLSAGVGVFNTVAGARAISKPDASGRRLVLNTQPNGFYAAYLLGGQRTVAQVGFATAAEVTTANYALTSVNVSDDSVQTWSIPAILSTDENDAFHMRGQLVSVDMDPDARPSANLMGASFLAGSLPALFDGADLLPQGALGTPYVTVATAGGLGIPAGTYSYVAQLQFNDGNGRLLYSSLSNTATVTVVASGVNITVNNLPLPVPTANVTLRLYRTTAGGSVFHLRETSRMDSIEAGGNLNFVVTGDAMTDAELEDNETLRVPTIELEPETPPAFRHIWSHRNRLFGINAETPSEVWYTKEVADPLGPQWSSVQVKRVENSGGELIAGASLGDKVLLFQRHQILAMNGEGPSALGPDANGVDGFSTPEIISLGIGAVDPFVVQIPGGVVFRSDTGFQMVGQDLSVNWVGKSVIRTEKTMGATTMAAYLPTLHQVWIQGADADELLVLDTRSARWRLDALPTGGRLVGAAEVRGVAYALNEDGVLWEYTPTDQRDVIDGEFYNIPVTVGTPWFRGAGAEGDMRVWQVVVTFAGQADAVTAHTFTASPGRARAKDPDTADGFYTLTLPEGMEGPYPVRLRPVKQRGSAFRCRLVIGDNDVISEGSAIAGPRITNIKYIYGVTNEDGKSPSTTVAS